MTGNAAQDLIYGVHAVAAAVARDPAQINEVWFQSGARNSRLKMLHGQVDGAGIAAKQVSCGEIDRCIGDVRHQGVIAFVLAGQAALSERDLGDFVSALTVPPLLLVLDGVQDPHNLGACLRTADAAGVQLLIVPKNNAVGLTPVVRKVACGAAEHVPLVQVSNLARSLRTLQDQGVWLVGADAGSGQSLYQADLSGPVAMVLGAEGRGLRHKTRGICDFLVEIPMAGTVSSLNVSVATGISLFEAVRQREIHSECQ